MRIMKKTTQRHIIIKLLKAEIKRKILKLAREKKAHYIQRNKEKYDRFLVRNNANEKTIE